MDLKGVTEDEISTKTKSSNMKIINANTRFYDKGGRSGGNDNTKNERRIWWIGWREWFGWKEWMSSKWRDKVDIARETEGTTSKEEL